MHLFFLLIGLEVLIVSISTARAGRAAGDRRGAGRPVHLDRHPLLLLRRRAKYGEGALAILTWGGLQGGIAVALALTLPRGTERDSIVAITYVFVVFSILVQGLSVKRLAAGPGLSRGPRGTFRTDR